ncbi:MAG: restriction endonuclease PLD domain-containing protein [Sedimenticola sp.]
MSKLISGNELKERLLSDIQLADSVKIISAYLTASAICWLETVAKSNHEIRIDVVSRLSPKDIVAGSSDLESIRKCLNNGWSVYALENLHAKIYLINNDKMYVGSSNFTSNGLKIFGRGNLEALVELMPERSDLEFINDIVCSSCEISTDKLKLMENYIFNHKKNISDDVVDQWPEDIIPFSTDVWVSDFPLSNPFDTNPTNDEFGPIFSKLYSVNPNEQSSNYFKQTKAYLWLHRILNDLPDREAYFGKLTQLLHSSIKDDPAPYRRDVKQLLANLLAFCEFFMIDEISIDRPNHSQCIRLKI